MNILGGDIIFYRFRNFHDYLVPGNFKHSSFCVGDYSAISKVIIDKKIILNEFQKLNINEYIEYTGLIILATRVINKKQRWMFCPISHLNKRYDFIISRYIKTDSKYLENLIEYSIAQIGKVYGITPYDPSISEPTHCHTIIYNYIKFYQKHIKAPSDFFGFKVILSYHLIDENYILIKF